MAKRVNFHRMPDYQTVTTDLDEHLKAWRDMAAPVEQYLGLKLTGFDPDFVFTKGNPHGVSTSVVLPVWFVRDLAQKLK